MMKKKNGGDASAKGGEDDQERRGQCWTSPQNNKANNVARRSADARLLDGCEAKRKEWAKHWQCDESVQNVEDKPWTNEELKILEEALPRLKECDLEKSIWIVQSKNRSGMRRILPESSLGLDKRNKKGNCRVPGEGGTSLHDDVLLDS